MRGKDAGSALGSVSTGGAEDAAPSVSDDGGAGNRRLSVATDGDVLDWPKLYDDNAGDCEVLPISGHGLAEVEVAALLPSLERCRTATRSLAGRLCIVPGVRTLDGGIGDRVVCTELGGIVVGKPLCGTEKWRCSGRADHDSEDGTDA